jgi:hypothetical protein
MSNDEVDSGGAIAAAIISATQDNDILDTNDEAANLCDGSVCLLGTSDAPRSERFLLDLQRQAQRFAFRLAAPSASSLRLRMSVGVRSCGRISHACHQSGRTFASPKLASAAFLSFH